MPSKILITQVLICADKLPTRGQWYQLRGDLFAVRDVHTYIKTSDTSTIVHEMMILYLWDILYSSLELGSTVARRKEYVPLSYSRLWGIHHFVPSGIAVDLTAKKPHVKSPEGRILLEYNLLRYHWVLLLVPPPFFFLLSFIHHLPIFFSCWKMYWME